jgi:hypothetical protein
MLSENKIIRLLIACFFIIIMFSVGCGNNFLDTGLQIKTQEIGNDVPEKISLCDLKNNPAAYNHKLIELTGFVAQAFEDFSIFDPQCSSDQCVWLEYGGTTKSGTVYCCGETIANSRSEPLVVEDIPIPLLDDENFKTFNKLLQRPPDSIVHSTIQGRFFSGEKSVLPGGTFYGGFGHFGMCSLLAIQQIIEVDSKESRYLDYRSSTDQPNITNGGGYKWLDTDDNKIEVQKQAETGERAWSFDKPERVAVEYLARLLKINEKSITGIKQTKKAQGRFVYSWKDKKSKTPYIIVVSRPYWLSFYAENPKKVAWIVIHAFKIT